MLRMMLAAVAAVLLVTGAEAQTDSCKAQASAKKLAGAALNSFMQKCERDSQARCDTSATEKKLSGAARTSYTTKCVRDAVGQ